MNKKDFNDNFKYYFKVILIAFIPIMVIMYFVETYVKNQFLVWLIAFLLVGVTLLIGFIVQQKKREKDNQNGKQKKFDPYAD